jgi:alkanesulfonate monooxygenase SsuD/methylene tetrahydromethanopterin reductase-like flavin-dependent oxidoreductase (luciferase family)
MDFGMFMEFGNRENRPDAGSFREGFNLVEAGESWGLDSAWLAEFHFNPVRSVLSSPIVVAGAIASRTKRMRVGMAVYVLPLNNPLRIAEEVATVDHISEGRFDFGIGRSGFARSYDIYGTPYSESQGRFRESLEIIRQAWKGETFSYQGEHFQIDNATVTPCPYQDPHPPLRMAAVTAETFPRVAQEGFPIFVGLRGMDIPELKTHLKVYRQAWLDAGHPGKGNVYLRVPVYAGATQKAAYEEPYDSITYYFNRQSRLVTQNVAQRASQEHLASEDLQSQADRLARLNYQDILDQKVIFGSAEGLIDRLTFLQEELGLDGIVAELNAGNLIPEEKITQSLKILTHKVMPAFK